MNDLNFIGNQCGKTMPLRSSKATVREYTDDNKRIRYKELTSYNTVVVLVDMVKNVIYLSAWFDCSMTTMRHVYKFFADYMDMYADIPTLRKADTIGKWTVKRVGKIERDWVESLRAWKR